MNRGDLERHLRKHGCQLAREGGRHSIGENTGNGKEAAVPRHNPVKRNTARSICNDLGIPVPPGF
ncbi:type II toxin-antitoxin system HicA family toxin [bacterium]|nr:MAG: type II toxin-antitoxin system HicA family toxin [bacterium]